MDTRLEIPFAGDYVASDPKTLSAQRLVNMYPEIPGQGAFSPIVFRTVPGLATYKTAGTAGARSDGVRFKDKAYFVMGSSLVSIDATGTVTTVGTLSTSTGWCGMAAGRVHLLIADGAKGYYTDGVTLTTIGDADFPATRHVAWLKGVFVCVKEGTDQFYYGDVADSAASWTELAWATAERKPDKILTVKSFANAVWFFGEATVEGYYLSGSLQYPFEPANAVMDYGTAAALSVADCSMGVAWLATTEKGGYAIMMASMGGQVQRLSTENLERKLLDYTDIAAAQAFFYSDGGHTFYVLTFPTSLVTWVYDLTTRIWHERTSALLGRWRAAAYCFLGGKHLVADYTDPQIYEMSSSTYKDVSDPIRREIVSQYMSQNGRRLSHHKITLPVSAGVGNTNDPGSDPEVMLEWSSDGMAWRGGMTRSIGKKGETWVTPKFYKLGSDVKRCYRVVNSSQTDFVVYKAYADISVGAY